MTIDVVSKEIQLLYAECRSLNHPWHHTMEHADYHYQGSKDYTYQRQYKCDRCGMVVSDEGLNILGFILEFSSKTSSFADLMVGLVQGEKWRREPLTADAAKGAGDGAE